MKNSIFLNSAKTVFVINSKSEDLIDLAGNRKTCESHIRSIKTALMINEFVPPIIIDGTTKSIIDGQHRYQAAKQIWASGAECELNVIVHDFKNPLLAAIKFNSKSKRWTAENYVNAYCGDGNINYLRLKEFADSHELTRGKYKLALLLILGKDVNIGLGNLIISEDLISKAKLIRRNLIKLLEASLVYGSHTPKFILAKNNVIGFVLAHDEITNFKKGYDKYLERFAKYFVIPADGPKIYEREYLDIMTRKSRK